MTVDELLERLDRVKKSGAGWTARCPAHEDREPSLSVSVGDEDKILLHCHSGCVTGAIVAALGLELGDLFVAPMGANEPIAVYRYVDEQGRLLFEVLRYAGKKFRQRRPDGNGGWIWNLRDVRRVLYRLPTVINAAALGETIYVVEGEKDVHAVEAHGGHATCSPGGAGKWKSEYAEALKGATVIIVADDDEPGIAHARRVAETLPAVTTTIVRSAEGKDAADHLAAGLTLEQLVPLADAADAPASGIAWTALADVEMRSIVFLSKPLLQADAFHLLVGRKGMGKGTLLAMIAAAVTRGELGERRNVLWVASEDSAAIDIKPRIIAAGGDPARIHIPTDAWIQLPRDLEELDHAMSSISDIGLIIIDPLSNHLGGIDTDKEGAIRTAISGLNKLADEHHNMVFGVRHLTEKECAKGVLAGILGSSAWVQVPRAVLAVVRDDEDPQVSHVQVVAGNRLPAGTPGRMFRIDGVLLDGLENEVTRASWIGDSTKDVETMLASSNNPGGKGPSKSAAARELILDILDSVNNHESDALDARVADETGLNARTVRNIRSKLKDDGLIRAYPEKHEDGTVQRWLCARTFAPRSRPSETP